MYFLILNKKLNPFPFKKEMSIKLGKNNCVSGNIIVNNYYNTKVYIRYGRNIDPIVFETLEELIEDIYYTTNNYRARVGIELIKREEISNILDTEFFYQNDEDAEIDFIWEIMGFTEPTEKEYPDQI